MHCGQHVIALFVVDALFGNQLARYEVSHELSHAVIKLKFPCVNVSEILECVVRLPASSCIRDCKGQ